MARFATIRRTGRRIQPLVAVRNAGHLCRLGQATQLHAGKTTSASRDRFTCTGILAGAVALLLTASDTQVAWGLIVPAFLLVLALLLVVWAAIGMHFARTLSRPLRQVSEALSAVGRGWYRLSHSRAGVERGPRAGQAI